MKNHNLAFNYKDAKTKHLITIPIELFKKPTNDKEYARIEKMLDLLIDEVRSNEKHPLATVMQIIGDNLDEYDEKHHEKIGNDVSEIEMIKYLMETHNLHQKDLAGIFGSQANVSKFLNGERKLSKTQISGIKKKFGISADFFFE